MLPDFPKIKQGLEKVINNYFREVLNKDPLFSGIKTEHHFEGNKISSKTTTNELYESEYSKVSSESSINKEDIIAKGHLAMIEDSHKIIEEIKKQKAELFFKKINEVTDKIGNIVDAKGREFSFEVFMELIDKIWIEFDKDGNPLMPTVVVSPELGEKLKTKLPEWESNPEYKRKLDELILRKRKEWNDRESNRKLVD